MGRGMLVQNWMSAGVIALPAEATVGDARKLLDKNKIRTIPITAGTHLLGIVSDRNIKNPRASLHDPKTSSLYAREEEIPLGQIMVTQVVTVTPHDHIATASNLTIKHKIGGLPVVENRTSKSIVGIITTTDLLKAFLTLMDSGNL